MCTREVVYSQALPPEQLPPAVRHIRRHVGLTRLSRRRPVFQFLWSLGADFLPLVRVPSVLGFGRDGAL